MTRRKKKRDEPLAPAEIWPRDVMVEPPAYGLKSPIVGTFKPGDGPRKVTLSAAQHAALNGADSPFKLHEIEE